MTSDFRLPAYLARLGLGPSVTPDVATLRVVHAAHVSAIPYDSFDARFDRPVPLDGAALQGKLVDSRRGGYCFEQNILFKAALEAMGFTVTGLLGRVLWRRQPGSPLGPLTHMLLKVDLAEGSYLADVGFGIYLLDAPLRLDAVGEQHTALGTFTLTRADGFYTLSAKQPGGWRDMYGFTLEPQHHADYELGNWYTTTHPKSIFRTTLLLERVTDQRRYQLINRRFITQSRDGVIEADVILDSPEAFGRVLDQALTITPPMAVADFFDRLSDPPRA